MLSWPLISVNKNNNNLDHLRTQNDFYKKYHRTKLKYLDRGEVIEIFSDTDILRKYNIAYNLCKIVRNIYDDELNHHKRTNSYFWSMHALLHLMPWLFEVKVKLYLPKTFAVIHKVLMMT